MAAKCRIDHSARDQAIYTALDRLGATGRGVVVNIRTIGTVAELGDRAVTDAIARLKTLGKLVTSPAGNSIRYRLRPWRGARSKT
jgi:hypothetical protein